MQRPLPSWFPKVFSIFICLIFFGNSWSQNILQNSSPPFWDQVRFGGGIGLSFGDGFFGASLSPSAIYQFNPHTALGVGLSGTYNSQKNAYTSTVFGASLIGLVNPIPEIQLSAEFEELHVQRKWDGRYAISNQDYWYPALFLGVGFGSRNVRAGIRYDVLYKKDKSIYAEAWVPFVRFYF